MQAGSMSEAYRELLTVFKWGKNPGDIDDIITELLNADESAFNISPGIYIPHLRLKNEKIIRLSVGLSSKGIAGLSGKKKLHLFFMELAPLKEIDDHIYFLAEVARLIERVSLKDLLREIRTSRSLYEKLLELYPSPGEK
jgi:mannitol/fructose-specific phosphotransferase system IIA component (Ntr-type)